MKEIVILHGWASKIKNWQPVIEEFEKQGFRVFLPRLPGFGKKMPEKIFGLNDYIKWLKNYLEERNLEKPVILGHSFGGRVAIKFASEYANSLSCLGLIASSGIRHPSFAKFFYYLLAKVGKLIFVIPIISFFKRPARWLFYTLIGEKDYYQANWWQKETLKKILKEDLSKNLGGIKAPTLILWGKKDRVTPVEDAYLLNREIRNSKLSILPDASHLLPFEEKKWLVEQVTGFLNAFL